MGAKEEEVTAPRAFVAARQKLAAEREEVRKLVEGCFRKLAEVRKLGEVQKLLAKHEKALEKALKENRSPGEVRELAEALEKALSENKPVPSDEETDGTDADELAAAIALSNLDSAEQPEE